MKFDNILKVFQTIIWSLATFIGFVFIFTGSFVNPVAYTFATTTCVLYSIERIFDK